MSNQSAETLAARSGSIFEFTSSVAFATLALGYLLGILFARQLTVGNFMTPRPATVSLEDTLDFVLHRMDGGNYRHVPVVANGQPLGVVSVRDMLRYITNLCKDG